MDEEPRARQWVKRIGAGSAEWLTYAGSALETKPRHHRREGGFYESVGYADLAISEYLRFRLGWNNAFRRPKAAGYAGRSTRFGDFFCNFCYLQKGCVVPVSVWRRQYEPKRQALGFDGLGQRHAQKALSVVFEPIQTGLVRQRRSALRPLIWFTDRPKRTLPKLQACPICRIRRFIPTWVGPRCGRRGKRTPRYWP